MNRWQQLQARYQQLQLRERVLVVTAIAVAVLFGGYSLVVEPALKRQATATAQLAAIERQTQQLSLQSADMQRQLADDPTTRVEAEVERLTARRDELDQLMAQATVDLIQPERMAGALQAAMAHGSGVELVSLETLPPEPIVLAAPTQGAEGQAPAAATEQPPALYRHPLRLTVRGSFHQVRALFGALDGLPWRFYWRQFDFQMKQYPAGELTLELYTLSTSQDWLKGGG